MRILLITNTAQQASTNNGNGRAAIFLEVGFGWDLPEIIGASPQLALPINLGPNEANYRSEAFMG